MNYKKSSLHLLGLLTGLILITGCVKKEFDTPPVIIPTVDFSSNMTIRELKQSYPGALTQITGDTIIQGIVTANDMSGNLYKTIYIQDSTAGIEVKVDMTSMNVIYPVGQRLYIKCKDLYLGNYNGVIQLGYIYNGAIGRIPSAMVPDHFFRDSLPGPAPQPLALDLNGSSAYLDEHVSMLVAIPDVRFSDAGQPFVAGADDYTNRPLADIAGNVIKLNGDDFIVRTSSYANFANTPMPQGMGTVVGILSVYGGQYQMYLRDSADFSGFDTTGIPSTLQTIYEQTFDVNPTDWVVYSVASNKDWTWDSQYTCMVANGYGGDVASEDWLISPGIDITGVDSTAFIFRTWTKYTDSGNPTPLEVFVSTDYSGSGNPSTATWHSVPATLPAANSATWTSSGEIDLTAYTGKIYIGFHYKSSGTTASTSAKWEVDSFKVTGYR